MGPNIWFRSRKYADLDAARGDGATLPARRRKPFLVHSLGRGVKAGPFADDGFERGRVVEVDIRGGGSNRRKSLWQNTSLSPVSARM